jgi:4-diphosphocytidyl-2-C-methyl-D-erythritol kinase
MRFRQAGQSLTVHAPAKLNLFLEILGKREDGFHELETLMMAVDIFDTLTFTEEDSNQIRLRCSRAWARRPGPAGTDRGPGGPIEEHRARGGRHAEPRGENQPALSPAFAPDEVHDDLPPEPDNLVVKAAQRLREHAGVERGVRIELVKRIPPAAGLAGGSSDAAATLMALNRFWKLGLGATELRRLASQLGSDVAFFVDGTSAAVCHGRGDIIEPLQVPVGLHFVVARPRTGLSTALVYKHCRVPARPQSVHQMAVALRRGQLGRVARLLHNSLQGPAEELNPEVSHLRSCVSRLPVLGHAMSGSGTAYFGLCRSGREARCLAGRLRAARVGRVWTACSRQ